MQNRKSRRASASNSRKAIRQLTKDAGVTEPTVDEKDPAFLALQLRSLVGAVEDLMKVQENNAQEVYRALSMVDAHQQVLSRVTRDLAEGLLNARRLQLAGDITPCDGDLGRLKLQHGSFELDLNAYYGELAQVQELAGREVMDVATVLWIRGDSVEDAVAHAKLGVQSPPAHEEPSDSDYVIEHFGGNSGQNHQQQDETPA